MIINKILKYLINFKYLIFYDSSLKFDLNGNIDKLDLGLLKDKKIENNLNGELQFLFILILYNLN